MNMSQKSSDKNTKKLEKASIDEIKKDFENDIF